MQPAPGGSSSGGDGGGGGGGGGGVSRVGGLGRLYSAPAAASWLEALLEEEEEDLLKPTQCLTELLAENSSAVAAASATSPPSLRSSVGLGLVGSTDLDLPGPFEAAGAGTGAGFLRQNSSPADFLGNSGSEGSEGYFSGFGVPASLDEFVSSSPNKRLRELEPDHFSTAKLSSQVKLEQGGLEDSVPCRVRAKRGFATHPRSIAERVRRTRISDRIRKLQELVPNMDKQTNTADMLDEAVEYVKFLQKQIQELSEHQRRCKCIAKE